MSTLTKQRLCYPPSMIQTKRGNQKYHTIETAYGSTMNHYERFTLPDMANIKQKVNMSNPISRCSALSTNKPSYCRIFGK